jgi:hypothetical protein
LTEVIGAGNLIPVKQQTLKNMIGLVLGVIATKKILSLPSARTSADDLKDSVSNRISAEYNAKLAAERELREKHEKLNKTK